MMSAIQFSCENAISIASPAVASKSSIPALAGLLLRAGSQELTISGYNMQTGIRTHVSASVAQEGEVVLDTRLFSDIVRSLPDDMVTFTVDTGWSPRVMVTRWKLLKPYSSSRLLSRNWPWRSSVSPGTSMGPEPRITEMSTSSPSSAAAARQRPASSVLPVLPAMHFS